MKTGSYPDYYPYFEKSNDNLNSEYTFEGNFFRINYLIAKIVQTNCLCPILSSVKRKFGRKTIDHAAEIETCNSKLKNIVDFGFALFSLIIFSPLFLVITILIKAESRGRIFYKPLRQGKGGNLFTCYKFRTMYEEMCDDPKSGPHSTVKNDPRVTPVGRFLRKYSLDELPQLINVLKGEMSIVGPRPHRLALREHFMEVDQNYESRYLVKPGLTGWAQVNGWRGPTVTFEQKNQRIKHDLWYIKHRSLWLDIKIIWFTIFNGGFVDPLSRS